jgi:type III pantothenate kinase
MKSMPPFLLVDLGNTKMKWATARDGARLRPAGEVPTAGLSAAWIAAFARKYREHQVVLASVVPRWRPAFTRAFPRRLHIVNGNRPIPGLPFDYPRPSDLGADRIAAAVAVQALGSLPVIIVACGTATAYTVLDAQGRLCGGVIAPGPHVQLSALSRAAAQLPLTGLSRIRGAIGKSTRDAIRLGVLDSFRGGVRETVQRLSDAFAQPPAIVVTGGAAKYLGNDPGFRFTLRPLLVLEGLHMIALRHQQASRA